MKPDPTFDRRKYLRVQTEQLISIGKLDEREGLAHALDLSMGGIRFQAVGLDGRVGDLLKVTLTLGQFTTTVVGQLVRAEALDEFTQEVALCFAKMEDAARRLLQAHLPPAEPSSDRRAYSRIQLESVVSVSRADVIDVVAQARDLSLGGIRFKVEDLDLELGDVVRVMLELGDAAASVIGQIVRLTDVDEVSREVALAFLEVGPESLELMRHHLPAPEDL